MTNLMVQGLITIISNLMVSFIFITDTYYPK